MKVRLLLALLLVTLASTALADSVYVGSYWVGAGPLWTGNPLCYTAQEAAALLFGGSANEYLISTDPSTINHLAWVDGWGNTQHLKTDWYNEGSLGPVAEDYKLQTGTGYNDPYGGPAFSAYVADHDGAYTNFTSDQASINYVWRSEVPEPASVTLLGLVLVSGVLMRRRYS
jgi:hypothetical protein